MESARKQLLYAITDRRIYGPDEPTRRQRLLELTAIWALNGVAFIQLREKDMSARDQAELARAMLKVIRGAQQGVSSQNATRLLISGRADVALAAGADGVHLASGLDALTPAQVRAVYAAASDTARAARPFVSLSCHTLEDVAAASRRGADCILFAPVFEKRILAKDVVEETLPGAGVDRLAEACRAAASVPIFALGGVTAENAPNCLAAGAAGVAAIRLMMEPPSVWRPLASPQDFSQA